VLSRTVEPAVRPRDTPAPRETPGNAEIVRFGAVVAPARMLIGSPPDRVASGGASSASQAAPVFIAPTIGFMSSLAPSLLAPRRQRTPQTSRALARPLPHECDRGPLDDAEDSKT